jgi:magnesium transporter
LRGVMRKIGRNGDLTSKTEDVLLGMARVVPYVVTNAAPYLQPKSARNSKACNATSRPSMITRRI